MHARFPHVIGAMVYNFDAQSFSSDSSTSEDEYYANLQWAMHLMHIERYTKCYFEQHCMHVNFSMS